MEHGMNIIALLLTMAWGCQIAYQHYRYKYVDGPAFLAELDLIKQNNAEALAGK